MKNNSTVQEFLQNIRVPYKTKKKKIPVVVPLISPEDIVVGVSSRIADETVYTREAIDIIRAHSVYDGKFVYRCVLMVSPVNPLQKICFLNFTNTSISENGSVSAVAFFKILGTLSVFDNGRVLRHNENVLYDSMIRGVEESLMKGYKVVDFVKGSAKHGLSIRYDDGSNALGDWFEIGRKCINSVQVEKTRTWMAGKGAIGIDLSVVSLPKFLILQESLYPLIELNTQLYGII